MSVYNTMLDMSSVNSMLSTFIRIIQHQAIAAKAWMILALRKYYPLCAKSWNVWHRVLHEIITICLPVQVLPSFGCLIGTNDFEKISEFQCVAENIERALKIWDPFISTVFQNIEWFLAYLPFKGIDQWVKKRFDSGIIWQVLI